MLSVATSSEVKGIRLNKTSEGRLVWKSFYVCKQQHRTSYKYETEILPKATRAVSMYTAALPVPTHDETCMRKYAGICLDSSSISRQPQSNTPHR